MIRVMLLAVTVVLVWGVSAQANFKMPVKVKLNFGGIDMSPEIPTQSSRFKGRMVYLAQLDEGETRFEFVHSASDGDEMYAPFTSTDLPYEATVSMGTDGDVSFKFSEPVVYDYILVNEVTGQEERRTGEIKSITAKVSQENREGLTQIVTSYPFFGFFKVDDFHKAQHLAEIYSKQKPTRYDQIRFGGATVPMNLQERPGLVNIASSNDAANFPKLLFPRSIPLNLYINPLTNEVVAELGEVIGSPEFVGISALTEELVGLDDNGSVSFGGPHGFSNVPERLRAVDLQEKWVKDFVEAQRVILRLDQRAKVALGQPVLTTKTGNGGEEVLVLLKNGGHGTDGSYADTFRLAAKECVNLLTGERLSIK